MDGTVARIALISAVAAAIGPATAAIAAQLPNAQTWNIIDDRLLDDAVAQGGLTPPLEDRMRRLIAHALAEGADGILLTCSLYGTVAAHPQPVPVLAPDQAAFDEIAAAGHARVLVVASLAAALDDSLARLRDHLAACGVATVLDGTVAQGAMAATGAGDASALLDALTLACRNSAAEAVYLAQYSLAPVATELAVRIGKPVVTGPTSAAARLRRELAA